MNYQIGSQNLPRIMTATEGPGLSGREDCGGEIGQMAEADHYEVGSAETNDLDSVR